MFCNFSILIISGLLFSANIVSEEALSQNNEKVFEVFVIQSRWHTGLILKTADIDTSDWPEIAQYRNYTYVDIGWGDEKFYQATEISVFLAAKAVLWPTPSILEIYAFNSPPENFYGPKARILRIPVTKQQKSALSRFVADSYLRNIAGQVQLSPLYETNTRFFLATRKYHLFRTCNTWMALAFKDAGFPVQSSFILNARQLFRQLKTIQGAEFYE